MTLEFNVPEELVCADGTCGEILVRISAGHALEEVLSKHKKKWLTPEEWVELLRD